MRFTIRNFQFFSFFSFFSILCSTILFRILLFDLGNGVTISICAKRKFQCLPVEVQIFNFRGNATVVATPSVCDFGRK